VTTLKHSLDLAARAAIAARTEVLFHACGTLEDGDRVGTGGRLDIGCVLRDPAAVGELCGYWASAVRAADGAPQVTDVAAVSPGAAVLAFEAARILGVHARYAAEPVPAGARVLLVDAAHAPGGEAIAGALEAMESHGAEVVACGTILDLADGEARVTSPRSGRRYPLLALWRPGT
jgi:hypothetical protein